VKPLPAWFERAENLAIAAAVVVVFVRLHFAWWWLPVTSRVTGCSATA
jgi:hypothetical protein